MGMPDRLLSYLKPQVRRRPCSRSRWERLAQFVGDLRQQRAGEAGFRHRAQIAALVGSPPDGRAPAEAPQTLQGLRGQKIVDHHDLRIALAPAQSDVPGIGGIDGRPRDPCPRFQVEAGVVDAVRRQPGALFAIVAQLVRRIIGAVERFSDIGHLAMSR